MKIFNHIWIIICIVFMMMGIVGCEENVQGEDKFIFDFPEEEIDIVTPDSSEIFVPSTELLEALHDTINHTKLLSQFYLDPSNKIFILLNNAENKKDSIKQKKAQNDLANITPDSVKWKKSLLGDYYKYKGEEEEDWEIKVEWYKKAAIFYEASFGSLSEDYLDIIYEVGVSYTYYLNEHDLAKSFVIKFINLTSFINQDVLGLAKAYFVMSHVKSEKAEYLSALCNIKISQSIIKDNNLLSKVDFNQFLSVEGDILFQLNEKELAYLCFDEILLDTSLFSRPKDGALYYSNYAMLLNADGKMNKANAYFKRSLELSVIKDRAYYNILYHYYRHLFKNGKNEIVLSKLNDLNIDSVEDQSTRMNFLNLKVETFEVLNEIDSAFIYMNKLEDSYFNNQGTNRLPSSKLLSRETVGSLGLNIVENKLRIESKYFAKNNNTSAQRKTLLSYKLMDTIMNILLNVDDEESQLHVLDYFSEVNSDALDGYSRLSKLVDIDYNSILFYMEQCRSLLLRRQVLKNRIDGKAEGNNLTKQNINAEWQNIKSNYSSYDNYPYLLECLKIENRSHNFNKHEVYKEHQSIALADLQQQLILRNSAMLSYYSFNNTLFGFSANRVKVRFKKWNIDSVTSDSIRQLKYLISHIQKEDSMNIHKYEYLAHKIYLRFVKPLLFKEKKKELLIIPSGPLLQLPFEALVSKVKNANSFNDLSYLIYNYRFDYMMSSDLYDISKVNTKTSKNIFVFSYSDKSTILDDGFANLAELPGAIKEVQQIEKFTSFSNISLFEGSNCTKSRFIEESKNANILHLATHAISDISSKRLNRIFFRSDGDIKDTSSWSMSPSEIRQLDLSTNLVFLSSCEAGMGKHYEGEGIFNLGRSFLNAGAKNVIQSYWMLDDQSSAEIVGGFYKYFLKDSSRSYSLYHSKLSYIKKWPDRVQPFFWSGIY